MSTGLGQDRKEEWAKIQKSSAKVWNFKPSDYIELPKNEIFAGCYGLIAPSSKCYAITVAPTKDGTRRFVANVKQCNPIIPEDSKLPTSVDVLKAPTKAPMEAATDFPDL